MNPLNDKPIDPEGQDQSRGEPMNSFNDKPIKQPGEDRFGFSPFAEAIAQSIIKNKNPEGTVIAINGPWGSGKSSVINLVKHYLKEKIKSNQSPDSFEFPRRVPNWLKSLAPERRSRQPSSDMSNSSNVPLEILDFKCWWFRGEEALMIEFFHQLYRALDKSGVEVAKKAVSRLGSIMLRNLAPLTGATTNRFAPGTGEMASTGMNFLSKIIQEEETVEMLYDKISQALLNSNKRYLMIIDDIDRLSPDEALLIFRLVKSVGRLTKITYLLAYDRKLAEKIVSGRYPSEGPHYLEKVVQASFDIPYPLRSDLLKAFVESIKELWKESQESEYWKEYEMTEYRHFWNLFDDVVAPQIQSPRDIIRIMNALKVSWPAVAGEVEPTDFLALEALRVKQPRLHAILKANKQKLIGIDIGVNDIDYVDKDRKLRTSRYEGIFLGEFQSGKREEIKKALTLLFPRLGSVWDNRENDSQPPFFDPQENWERQRRACSAKYFDAYFRFSLSPEALSMTEIRSIIENSGDKSYVKQAILEADSTDKDNENGSNLERLLDGLKPHIKTIPTQNAPAFLSGLFSAYDDVNVVNIDKIKTYTLPLLENLLLNRTILDERSVIVYSAVKDKSLELIAFLTRYEYKKYHPQHNESPKHENEHLVTESHMEWLRQIVLNKIRAVAKDDSLLENRELLFILATWEQLLDESQNNEIKSWCVNKLNEDNAVYIFAKALSEPLMAREHPRFLVLDTWKTFFNIEKLRQRVDEVLLASEPGNERYEILNRFKTLLNEYGPT